MSLDSWFKAFIGVGAVKAFNQNAVTRQCEKDGKQSSTDTGIEFFSQKQVARRNGWGPLPRLFATRTQGWGERVRGHILKVQMHVASQHVTVRIAQTFCGL